MLGLAAATLVIAALSGVQTKHVTLYNSQAHAKASQRSATALAVGSVEQSPSRTHTNSSPDFVEPDGSTPPLALPSDQSRQLVREVYSDLIVELELSPDTIERFLDVVAEDWTDPPSVISSKKHVEDIVVESELRTLLGYDNFLKYEAYQTTLEERNVIRGLEREIAASGATPLNDEIAKRLLAVLLEEHSAIPPRNTEETRSARLQYIDLYEEAVLRRAEFILDDAQLIVLRNRFERAKNRRYAQR
jgi:hypothetical protein